MYYCVQQNELGSFSVAACNLLNSGLFTSAKKKKNAEVIYSFKVCLGKSSASFLPRSVGFEVETFDINLHSRQTNAKNPILKTSSEASPMTNFSFYLTFATKYHFYYMRCRHLGCISYFYRLFAIKTYLYL